MSVDTRPKFAHFLSNKLVQSRIRKNFWSQSFITLADLLFLETVAFEKCGIIGSMCSDERELFSRVLAAPEGREADMIAIFENMSERMVLPFMDSPTVMLLIIQQTQSKMMIEEEITDFLAKYGKSKSPVDKSIESVSVWGNLGGYIGLEYPEYIEGWLRFPEDIQKIMTARVAERLETEHYSIGQAEQDNIDIFGEFCRTFYPKEVEEFYFL